MDHEAQNLKLVSEIGIPDSRLGGEVTEFVREANHRYCFTIPAGSTISARWLENAAACRSIGSCSIPVRCSTIWARSRATAVPMNASKSMGPTLHATF